MQSPRPDAADGVLLKGFKDFKLTMIKPVYDAFCVLVATFTVVLKGLTQLSIRFELR